MIKVLTPPNITPVTPEEISEWTRGMPVDSSVLSLSVASALEAAAKYTHRSIGRQTLQIEADVGTEPIILPRPPFVEIISVKQGEIDVTDQFTVDDFSFPAELKLIGSVDMSEPVTVTYIAGSDTVTEAEKQAILIYVVWTLENPGAETAVPRAFYNLLGKVPL